MFSSTLFAAVALTAQQPIDASSAARNAYTACLRQFMDRGVSSRMSESAFNEALPRQCGDQERAFRQAIATREAGFQTPAAEVEQIVTDELTFARTNIREMFAMSTTPR